MNLSSRVSLILSLLLTAPAFARLGDTPEQCNQRYGAKYIEKGGEGFWTAERSYEINGIRLTLRFLPANDGTTKAAYINYKPIMGKMSDVQIQTLLVTVSQNWTPLKELREEKKVESKTTLEADKTRTLQSSRKIISIETSSGSDKRKKEAEEKAREDYLKDLAAKNKAINETKDRVQSAAEWYEPRSGDALNFFTSHNAFAGSSPQRVVILSSEYLRQHEKGAETTTAGKTTTASKDASVFKGF
ncbi:MAG: hypothetical protein WCI03_13795 [bacterium]